MPFELFIGLRYLKAKRKSTFISLITLISVAGVALGEELHRQGHQPKQEPADQGHRKLHLQPQKERLLHAGHDRLPGGRDRHGDQQRRDCIG